MNSIEKSSESAVEEFKSVLMDTLNDFPEDIYTGKRWFLTKTFEGNSVNFFYDGHGVATLTVEEGDIHFKSVSNEVPRVDDILFALRLAAEHLSFAVYSNNHSGARLPKSHLLSLDHSYFRRNKLMADFFDKNGFIPRYSDINMNAVSVEEGNSILNLPIYAENKIDGSVHIINNMMLDFLLNKENKEISEEFSYKVSDSMNDFAKKYDFGLVPFNFYQNFKLTTKIINYTYFDVFNVSRKVFISPFIWDFDSDYEPKYYQNIKNGIHFMDKIRNGETLDNSLKRILSEELQISNDYVGAAILDIEFDRDREGILTPRLRLNVFVNGLNDENKKKNHDWVTLK